MRVLAVVPIICLIEFTALAGDSSSGFLEIAQGLRASSSHEKWSLDGACHELSQERLTAEGRAIVGSDAFSITDRAYALGKNVSVFLWYAIPTLASEVARVVVGPGPEMRRYLAELEDIRRVGSRSVRLARAYNLAISALPHWEESATWFVGAPSALMKKKKNGDGAKCRDFSWFLMWTLQQVARPESARSNLGALGADDFVVTTVGVHDHDWVRVLLPEPGVSSDDWPRIDLDPTFYPVFTPLYPRRSGLPEHERTRLLKACTAAQNATQGALAAPDQAAGQPPAPAN
jgi:hypothetical protein